MKVTIRSYLMEANNTQPDCFDKENEVRLAEEAEWMQQASQGDQDGFTKLYDRYIDCVYRYFYSRVGSVSEAETLTSKTFTQVVESFLRGHYILQSRCFVSLLSDMVNYVLVDHICI